MLIAPISVKAKFDSLIRDRNTPGDLSALCSADGAVAELEVSASDSRSIGTNQSASVGRAFTPNDRYNSAAMI